MGLLKNVAVSSWMIPTDWDTLTRACLTPAQFLQCRTWWAGEASIQTARSAQAQPQINITADQLLGVGGWAGLDAQVVVQDDAIEQLRGVCIRAREKITSGGEQYPSFSAVKQGPKETYTDFIARLQESLKKVIADLAAQGIVLQLSAFDNANPDCQAALRPIRGKAHLVDYIKACDGIGGNMHKATLLVQAMVGLRVDKGNHLFPGACFNCGKHGHTKQERRKNQRVRPPDGGRKKTAEPEICPKCEKGKRWANQCHSKFDKDGNPILGNTMRGPSWIPFQTGAFLAQAIPSPLYNVCSPPQPVELQ
nr:endogenous retrovirus group K member 9 Gag polyprotein-like isoform X1 [Gorilla gorilla gorilla]XP_055223811.1 endogenous retrovirus group K member 9 Gag polyprotein-like isoform X1 [Gorilla gorilla gorilla]